MTQEKAIIIAAFISSCIAVGGIILTQLFNYLYRKADFNNHFFFEAYQKRLAIYQDTIKELMDMNIPDIEAIANITNIEIAQTILPKVHLLDNLIARLTLFGSSDSVVPLRMLREPMFLLHSKGLSDPLLPGHNIAIELTGIINTAHSAFICVVSRETGSNFVDKRVSKILKKTTGKKLQKKPSRNNN